MLKEKFGTDQACLDFIVQEKWGGIPTCHKCGSIQSYYLKSRKIYKCKECSTQYSVIQGTLFEKSRIPLTKWFEAIYFFTTTKGISSCQLAKHLGLPQPTAYKMMQRMRCSLKGMYKTVFLSGDVEVDEGYLYPKLNRNMRSYQQFKKLREKTEEINGLTAQQMRKQFGTAKGYTEILKKREMLAKTEVYSKSYSVIFGMQERNGDVVLYKLGSSKRSFNAEKVLPLMFRHIDKECRLFTDEQKVYKKARGYFENHKVIQHDKRVYVQGYKHTNNIECTWRHLKKLIYSTYMGVSFKHMDKYLNEFMYRYNLRHESTVVLFNSFLPFVVQKKKKMDELGPFDSTYIEAA